MLEILQSELLWHGPEEDEFCVDLITKTISFHIYNDFNLSKVTF